MSEPDLSYIPAPLRSLAVPINTLTPDPKNARKRTVRNKESIRQSLKRFGFVEPIVVQRQGMIIRAGNGRVAEATSLGWTHVPAVIVDQNDVEATAYGIASNRTAELAEWDNANLHSALALVHELGDGDLMVGFNTDDMAAVAAQLESSIPTSLPPTPPEEFPEISASIEADFKCPQCAYEWSGKAR